MPAPLAPLDFLDLKTLTDPQVSPDGTQIAFVLVSPDRTANRQHTSIWVVPSNGSSPARALTFGTRDVRPRWAPDGRRLAFLSARSREWAKDLYTLDMGGGEPALIASLPRGIEEYEWSPDGSRFCLTGGPEFPPEPDREPARDAEEAHRRYLERMRRISHFRYRADGRGQLDEEPAQIWVVSAEGGEPRRLTELPIELTRPTWTPDGRIAFIGSLDAAADARLAREVCAVDPDAALPQVAEITDHGKAMSAYGFAPDGTLMVVRADAEDPFGGRHQWAYIGDRCVTRDLDRTVGAPMAEGLRGGEARNPQWMDGHFYFDLADQGCGHFYRVSLTGTPEPVITGRRVVQATVAGGVAGFVQSSADDLVSLRSLDLVTGEERVLFEPNPWLRERDLGELREFDFEHDGRRVQAWMMLPIGHREGRRVPTVQLIHGGPHAAYSWAFPLYAQVLAGAGYAVVYSNPPGSQSFGEEYARTLSGRWGEYDFPYQMRLADRAVEAGFADPERMGVAGGSYGGFMTLWMVSHTDRYRAAVSMRPVSDLLGMIGSSDIGWSFQVASVGYLPWENPERYRELSPVNYLDRINTPVRLIASDGDLRTHVEQAEQVFVRLKLMGKETDLMYFHAEPHALAIVGRPWNRANHMRVIVEWFDRHLKC